MLPRACPTDCRKCRVPIHMTAARTIFQFRHGVEDCRRIYFFVRIRPEVSGMATGAVRLVGSKSPGNDFIIGRVTSHTGDARSMRFVRDTSMGIRRDRYPSDTCPVTGIARLRGHEV